MNPETDIITDEEADDLLASIAYCEELMQDPYWLINSNVREVYTMANKRLQLYADRFLESIYGIQGILPSQ